MAHENKTYAIVTVANAGTFDYSQLITYDNARATCNDKDGNAATQKIISWNNVTYPSNPPTVSGKLETVDSRTTHTHSEIKAIMAADLNWLNPGA